MLNLLMTGGRYKEEEILEVWSIQVLQTFGKAGVTQ